MAYIKLVFDCDLSDAAYHRDDIKDAVEEFMKNQFGVIVEKAYWKEKR